MSHPEHIPPYLRKPAPATRDRTVWMLGLINVRLKRLAGLGLEPHPSLLEYRKELQTQLEHGGPYELRTTSRIL